MNIKNPELIQRLATFKPLFKINPQVIGSGQLIAAEWSRGILLEPTNLRLIAKEFVSLIDFNQIDVIAGIELQGVYLATAIALETNKPMVIVREKPKRLGRSAVVGDVNFIFPGARALLVDDLMSFGGTKEARTKILEAKGAKVTGVAVFLYANGIPPTKRISGGNEEYIFTAQEWLRERDICLHQLIELSELARLQMEAGVITQEMFDFIKENPNGPYWENTDNLMQLYKFMKKEGIKVEDFVLQFMKEHGVKI